MSNNIERAVWLGAQKKEALAEINLPTIKTVQADPNCKPKTTPCGACALCMRVAALKVCDLSLCADKEGAVSTASAVLGMLGLDKAPPVTATSGTLSPVAGRTKRPPRPGRAS